MRRTGERYPEAVTIASVEWFRTAVCTAGETGATIAVRTYLSLKIIWAFEIIEREVAIPLWEDWPQLEPAPAANR